MGTNYYAQWDSCKHCKRADEYDRFHVGKSSWGWMFSLHVIEQRDWDDDKYGMEAPQDYEGWLKFLTHSNVRVFDEYSQEMDGALFMDQVVANRQGDLQRHSLDGKYYTANGKGTWDMCRGEYS